MLMYSPVTSTAYTQTGVRSFQKRLFAALKNSVNARNAPNVFGL